ncbi:MAG TPA: lipase secretion chaperone [Duganella sp.]|nr:lipase secretion chaperone [Duganella sp.]
MDSYLLGGGDKGGLQALLDYLDRHLPVNAAREAGQLATSYNAYLSAHDQLLAVQNFGERPDLNRLAGWQRQRQQLRGRMLGEKVSQEWFGTEEAYLTQALEELGQRRDGMVPPSTSVDEDQLNHEQHMRQVLRDAIIRLRPPT